MKSILSIIGRLLYFILGWTYDDLPEYWSRRCVVIGFPHTSNMDTLRALTYIKIAKIDARLLVKAGWFFFPMSLILKSLGGIPVKRNKSLGFVDFAVQEFNKREELILALVPEGTRKNVKTIKTGFWHIANGSNVPIMCWFLDNESKRTRWVGKIDPKGDLEADLLKIHHLYKKAGLLIPLDLQNPLGNLSEKCEKL
ncbi:MAG: 1-acyl-sn-glycerol-3-phosphate acyltransferase [Desulfobacula sp.]|nr:1-acyl-sn-glycerol-3-phosphate acyltransferase [Desulfobacula sp.]